MELSVGVESVRGQVRQTGVSGICMVPKHNNLSLLELACL